MEFFDYCKMNSMGWIQYLKYQLIVIFVQFVSFPMEDKLQPKQDVIIEEKDQTTGTIINRYRKGKMLGKGGFAKCYEFTNLANNYKYAAKIIEKSTLTRSKAKQKLASEIKIHKSVKSPYVVRYQRFFEDSNNVYIILQLCPNQTLNELIKRRKRITQIQAKYYMRQIALAVKDFQKQLIIHRDLKLGNLLLTDTLEIRISDFGLAAKLGTDQDRRRTMCGTPNYIAPEILENNNGHSYEVDIWSMGVIAYAFIVGRPPFQTSDVKTTYNRIKMCSYSFPETIVVSTLAKNFISKMLQKDPKHRSTIDEILGDEFLTTGGIPHALPMTTIAAPPNAAFMKQYNLEAESSGFKKSKDISESQCLGKQDGLKTDRCLEKGESVRTLIRTNSIEQGALKSNYIQRASSTAALTRNRLVSSKVEPKNLQNQAMAQGPFVWVTYFEENPKFGVSYLLNSNSTGMKFNDSTCLVSNSIFSKLKYVQNLSKGEQQKKPLIFDLNESPESLTKKIKIISYYQKQLRSKKESDEHIMSNQQLIIREKNKFRETGETALTIFVVKHCKTSKANIFWFNNKDYQIIFKDFTELLLSKDSITYVNKVGERKYFNKDHIEEQPEEIKKRMKYTLTIVQTIKESTNKGPNKQNKPEDAQPLVRSSSVYKIEKPKPTLLKGSASTSRITNTLKMLKY